MITALLGGALLTSAAVLPALVSTADSASASAASTGPSSHQRQDRSGHRIVHHDARHDVLRLTGASEKKTPAPRDRSTDITTTVVDHRVHRLLLRAHVRHLTRSGYRLMITEVLTSDGKRYDLVLDYSTTPIGPRVTFERFKSGQDVACSGVAWSVKRTSNRVAASVPTSCLGDPGWVRVGVGMIGARHDLKTSWVDDSRTRGHVSDQHLRLGPRQPQA